MFLPLLSIRPLTPHPNIRKTSVDNHVDVVKMTLEWFIVFNNFIGNKNINKQDPTIMFHVKILHKCVKIKWIIKRKWWKHSEWLKKVVYKCTKKKVVYKKWNKNANMANSWFLLLLIFLYNLLIYWLLVYISMDFLFFFFCLYLPAW